MNFETFTRGQYKFYSVYLAGFHDSRTIQGELFFSRDEAESYCADKVIHVKSVDFWTHEKAEDFVNSQARRWINLATNSGLKPLENTCKIKCCMFKKIVESLIE